jgi:DNA-binding MarR family transcriptional regulator
MSARSTRKLRRSSRAWLVLNYAVTEPNQWTSKAIADDLGLPPSAISTVILSLVKRGFVVRGAMIGKARALFPTPLGVEALHVSL